MNVREVIEGWAEDLDDLAILDPLNRKDLLHNKAKKMRAYAASQSEAVQRDAARLDDMERTKCYPFWNGNGWTYIVAPERSSKIERKGVGSTVREAIDAAMRSSAPLESK